MRSSNEYSTAGDGNGKSGKTAPSQAAECDVGLALNMQHTETAYPSKKMSFMSNPSLYHHPQYRASIDFGGGHGSSLLFDNSSATSNHIASGTSFINTTGGEMQKMIFTASQLQEFENQTMIYNHIMSSNPIPPQLLLPLSTQYNKDSEPWRCRRTDGKKWRCSRDVMPDQKYCERHAHKNRPRSRKPVETQSQSTKNLKSNDNYHSILPPAPSMPTSCQQSRCTEWFMRGGSGTIPLSSSHQKIQKPMPSPSVGSKRDHFFQNLDGKYQDLVEGDSCSLSLMQPGGDYACADQDFFQMGTGMSNADGSNPQNQMVHQGSWLGGPLGEALCPGVVSSLNQPTNVPSQNDSSHGLH
ncbi:hypothetical protein L1987_09653 [Smallanthus sonchifolius]|uniref:Uncharacterized protein n=1 Tax=Smallanthus sonchifolius TaxID=185202 RepID=A0ACB9JPZ2_9ASTR|nr:hypothetical protein L1987_09653 [Smallanthus sonchifolius]